MKFQVTGISENSPHAFKVEVREKETVSSHMKSKDSDTLPFLIMADEVTWTKPPYPDNYKTTTKYFKIYS